MKEIHCTDCNILMVRLIKLKKVLNHKSTLLCDTCATNRMNKRK